MICSLLLNCLRSIVTIVVTTESGQNSLQVIFTVQFLTKLPFFAVFMYFLYNHPRCFNSSENINNTDQVSRLSFRFLWPWSWKSNQVSHSTLSSREHVDCNVFLMLCYPKTSCNWSKAVICHSHSWYFYSSVFLIFIFLLISSHSFISSAVLSVRLECFKVFWANVFQTYLSGLDFSKAV